MGDQAGLIARLRAEGLDASAWWQRAGRPVRSRTSTATTRCWSWRAGSIRFGLPERGETVDLAIGDRLDLPAGTVHDATVGPDGVTCLEAHAPAGTLPTLRRVSAGDW